MKHLSSNGFTIVESMMVLIVSGALFASSIALVSGQQSKVQFKSAVTDITSKIQSTINEAASGYYPGDTSFKCDNNSSKIKITPGGGGREQGENTDCVYLGRAMMLGIPGPANSPQEYIVHTVVGLKKNPGTTKEALTFNEAQAVPIFRDPPDVVADISESFALQYGLRVLWMRGPANQRLAGVGFVMNPSQASYGGSGDAKLQSGNTSVSIAPIYSGGADEDGLTAAQGAIQITDTLRNQPLLDSARICFTDGGDRSALVNIGAAGGGSSVEYTIFPSPNCT